MPRKARTAASVQAAIDDQSGPARKRLRGGLTKMELISAVCTYFCKGHTATEIVKHIKKAHKYEMRREEPYQYITYAAGKGWLRFAAPHEYALRERIKRRCHWLKDVKVVETATYSDVAYHGAEMLVELLQEYTKPPYNRDKVHIGFAGGHAMRKVAQHFAGLLGQPTPGLPKTIVFHSMAAGFEVGDPSTSPNSFCSYLLNDPRIQAEIEFVGLYAPALVKTAQLGNLKSLHAIGVAFGQSRELDIIVTSASLWSDEHSMLHKYMGRSESDLSKLETAGCIGDMLWRPIGEAGPIETKTDIRAMTLVELSDLPDSIKKGKHVVLVLGPCGGCHQPKTEMLKLMLKLDPPLITHLVVDSRSARDALLELD